MLALGFKPIATTGWSATSPTRSGHGRRSCARRRQARPWSRPATASSSSGRRARARPARRRPVAAGARRLRQLTAAARAGMNVELSRVEGRASRRARRVESAELQAVARRAARAAAGILSRQILTDRGSTTGCARYADRAPVPVPDVLADRLEAAAADRDGRSISSSPRRSTQRRRVSHAPTAADVAALQQVPDVRHARASRTTAPSTPTARSPGRSTSSARSACPYVLERLDAAARRRGRGEGAACG